MKTSRREIGLAIVGCGTIGQIRAKFASEYPGIKWIGLCDLREDLGHKLKEDVEADFFTTDYKELLARPEVDAVIIATDEQAHAGPTLCAVDHGHALFIEKPLATDATESAEILDAIEKADIDAVVGYTVRFRRRFLAVKEKIVRDQIGSVSTVVARAFMNRMAPIATIAKATRNMSLTPMVVSGTHSLDMCLWMMEGKNPVSIYARSVTNVLEEYGTKDATVGIFTMDDGSVFSMNISWALPTQWPGPVYGIQLGIVGTKGVIDIEDTHRDVILASETPQGAGYAPDGFAPGAPRHVDFLTTYPPGDIWAGQLWGPMKEETISWFQRLCMGAVTPHASAQDGHRNLMLTMAMDASARTGKEVTLPADPAEIMRELSA